MKGNGKIGGERKQIEGEIKREKSQGFEAGALPNPLS